MMIQNQNYGGFKRRKAEQEKREKELAEQEAKRALEPKTSELDCIRMINYMSGMAMRQQSDFEDKVYLRRKENGGW